MSMALQPRGTGRKAALWRKLPPAPVRVRMAKPMAASDSGGDGLPARATRIARGLPLERTLEELQAHASAHLLRLADRCRRVRDDGHRGQRAHRVFFAVSTHPGGVPLGAPLVTEPWHLYLTLGVLVGGGSVCLGYSGQSLFLPNWFVRRRGLAIGIAFAGVGV